MTWNIAHRGGAGLWPENTLLAFEESARAGYDGAELDVQLTADGTCVVFHDRDIAAGLALTRLRYAELQHFNVGAADLSQQIPTLQEVIACVRSVNPQFRLLIELKLYPTTEHAGLAEALARAAVAAVRDANFDERALFVGFEWTALAEAKRFAPGIPVWLTTPVDHGIPGRVIDAIVSIGAQGWFAHISDATAEHFAATRAENASFGVWTVNDDADLRRCTGLGVDAICTDFPDRLCHLRDHSPSNSAVER